jgi:hypothetical protein
MRCPLKITEQLAVAEAVVVVVVVALLRTERPLVPVAVAVAVAAMQLAQVVLARRRDHLERNQQAGPGVAQAHRLRVLAGRVAALGQVDQLGLLAHLEGPGRVALAALPVLP